MLHFRDFEVRLFHVTKKYAKISTSTTEFWIVLRDPRLFIENAHLSVCFSSRANFEIVYD